ncbi:MAG: hypothetical protein WEA99_01845 [Brumimicrobium sp.]
MKISAHYKEDLQLNHILQRFNSIEISEEFKILLSNLTEDNDSFNVNDFYSFDLSEVLSYLKSSHDYYLNSCLPKIENTLSQLSLKNKENDRSTKVFTSMLNKYKSDLINHINEEEKVLFAYVEKLLAGNRFNNESKYVLNHFIHSHNDEVVLEIDLLKKAMIRFNSELEGDLLFEVLFDQLELLQNDLTIHALIEDHVFVPMILDQA